MNSVVVGLIITGVVALILLLSVLWGIKRGLKKTLFRLAWLLVTAVVLFFTVPPLSNWLNTFDLSSLNLDICGKVTKLSDIGINLVNSFEEGKEALQNSEALTSFVENLPTMVLNILLFVVLFWLLKAILWVVWAPIASSIFDKQKRERKKFKKEQKKLRKQNKGIEMPKEEGEPILLNVKENKHRAWGAVFGFVLGLILCAVTFSPIVGLNAIYQTAYASIKTQDEDGNEVPYLSQVIDAETRSYIESYDTSIGSKILKYSGMEFMSNLMFGSLATVQVGEQKVSLMQEVSAASNVLNSVESIKNFDSENISQENIERLILDVRTIFIDLEDSQIIYLLGDQLIPYFLDSYLEENEITIIDGDMLDKILLDAYKEFSKQFNLKELKNQLSSILDVASELNSSNLLAPIINGEANDAETIVRLIGSNVTNVDKFADTLVDALYNVSILQSEYPQLVNTAIESLFTALNIEFTEQTIDAEQLKNDFNTIINKLIYVCRYYSKNDRLDFGNYTTDMMTTVGSVLDTVKSSIISSDNFSALVDYAKQEINKALTDVVDLTSIVESIKTVEDWENELSSLSTIYKSVVKLVNAEPDVDKIMAGEFDEYIKNIGKGFDSAITGNSILVNNENIRTALEAFVSKIDTTSFDELLNVEVDTSETLKQQLYNNIYNTSSETSQIKKWENELKYNLEVVKAAYNINQDGFDLTKLSSQENNQLSQVGYAIDEALERTNLILSNKTIRSVFDYYLNKIEMPEEVNKILNIEVDTDGKVSTVLQIALNNIYNKSNGYENPALSYQNELLKIKNVLTVDFENATFVEFGATLDNLLGSNILTKDGVINEVVKHYVDEETTSLDEGLQTALNSMKANLRNVTSYAKEFEYIEDLLDVLNASYQTDMLKFQAFGHQFNVMCDYNDTIGSSSKLFTKPVINEFITYYFDEFVNNNLKDVSQGIKDIVNSVKNNLSLIENYENELVNFLNLADYVDGSIVDINGDQVQDLKDIGKYLDDMTSDIITSSVIKNLIAYYIDEETSSLKADLKAIVADITANVKNENTIINSYELEFGLLLDLTAQIEKETIDTVEVGKVFDKLQAQSNIVTRPVLEKFVKYFFDDYVSTNLSSQDKAGLKAIVEGIANNISDIDSFEKEFTNLDKLFDIVNSTDKSAIGLVFDQITLTNSKLIKESPNMHAMVEYFFDDYVSTKLDAETDADLIAIIDGIKENIPEIESYKAEFDNLESLFNVVNNADKSQIGSVLDKIANSNSKLIKKDPNMFEIVEYFFDEFISEKLDAETDADLIEIINGMKANISSIESFETEFDNLELLINNVENTDKTAIGEVLDTLVSANSQLIKEEPNIHALVAYFFDDYVSTKLDAESDAGLITIVEGIKENISAIESYKTEFEHLTTLFDVLSSTSHVTIGETLDGINGNSKLILQENLQEIVVYFFDEKTQTYKTDYADTIALMRTKIGGAYNYKNMFTELETIMANFDTLATLNSVEAFKNSENVGTMLDDMAKMSQACDKNIAYSIAEVVFSEFLTCVESEYNTIVKTQIESLMNNEIFSFNTYNPADDVEYVGSHPDENYYKDLVDAIQEALSML